MDEVMNWLTIAPELLHHCCLNLQIEGPDVTLAFSDELIQQALKVTWGQGYCCRCADLTFLKDLE
jgi:hypothetical protein